MFLQIIGQIVTLIAVILGINGNTYDRDKKGINKILPIGWLTIFIALIGTIISIFIQFDDQKDKEKIEAELTNSNKLQEISKNKIDDLNTILTSYERVIDRVKNESNRQPQIVMSQYVDFTSTKNWIAPNEIFSGSIVKFLGFKCELVLEYNGRRESVPQSYGRTIEIPIVGNNGSGFKWRVKKSDSFPPSNCQGKIYVESTPRIRSSEWSWMEEELIKINDRYEKIKE